MLINGASDNFISKCKYVHIILLQIISLDCHVHLYLGVRLVVGDNKVLISETVNIRHFPLEFQLGKLPRLTLKLHLHTYYFISTLMKFIHTKYMMG